MKNPIIHIFALTLCITNITCSQSDANMLAGEWKYADESECPDIIEFETHGKYNIFNDCGCIDPMFPIIERGSWEFRQVEKRIVLSNREFVSPNSIFSEFHGKSEVLEFKVEHLSNTKLTISFYSDKNDYVSENYARIEKQ